MMFDLSMFAFIFSNCGGVVTWKIIQVNLNKNPQMSLYLSNMGELSLENIFK